MSAAQSELRFDGPCLEESDKRRLGAQLAKVRELTADGRWWTLSDLALYAGCSESGAGARLRDLRKARFGGHTVERRRILGSVAYEYRVVPR